MGQDPTRSLVTQVLEGRESPHLGSRDRVVPGGRAGGPAGPAGLGDRALGRERRGVRTDP
ncbi:hypothetical protein [Mycobacterium marinum]|uniref:hypothetical protein n=1 Tax=Mycobacterium marinum TaxID=1781 RepID=UPI0013799324|nr:hypothetical protein [Mycobacterium marinum]